MSSKQYIKKAVKFHQEKCIPTSLNRNWVIGLTNDDIRRYGEHKTQIKHSPRYWRCWLCNSYEDALELEKYFFDKGYNVGLGGTAQNSLILYMYYLPREKHLKTKVKAK
jgi:hypothetical protein